MALFKTEAVRAESISVRAICSSCTESLVFCIALRPAVISLEFLLDRVRLAADPSWSLFIDSCSLSRLRSVSANRALDREVAWEASDSTRRRSAVVAIMSFVRSRTSESVAGATPPSPFRRWRSPTARSTFPRLLRASCAALLSCPSVTDEEMAKRFTACSWSCLVSSRVFTCTGVDFSVMADILSFTALRLRTATEPMVMMPMMVAARLRASLFRIVMFPPGCLCGRAVREVSLPHKSVEYIARPVNGALRTG